MPMCSCTSRIMFIILSRAREAGSPVKPPAAAPTRHGPWTLSLPEHKSLRVIYREYNFSTENVDKIIRQGGHGTPQYMDRFPKKWEAVADLSHIILAKIHSVRGDHLGLMPGPEVRLTYPLICLQIIHQQCPSLIKQHLSQNVITIRLYYVTWLAFPKHHINHVLHIDLPKKVTKYGLWHQAWESDPSFQGQLSFNSGRESELICTSYNISI